MAEAFPGKVIVNGRWDPREGEEGLRRFEENHKRDNYKGVKLYTAEWYGNLSRGYKVSDPEAYRYLDKTRELGIKNVHLHKGPRSGRWTGTRSTSRTSTRPPRTSPNSTSSWSTRACRGSSNSPTSRCRSPTCTQACPW